MMDLAPKRLTEKESVLAKIREAKSAAKTASLRQLRENKRGGHKKSYEPEA
ncbi:MAG: hypothetical protein LBK41_05060 [Clostridiales bacterium]|jgi:hypothetical protein|nr:hypothetical protein [Clostridiales bacterium]